MASDDNSFFGLKVPDGNDRRELYKSQYRAIYTYKMSAQELDQAFRDAITGDGPDGGWGIKNDERVKYVGKLEVTKGEEQTLKVRSAAAGPLMAVAAGPEQWAACPPGRAMRMRQRRTRPPRALTAADREPASRRRMVPWCAGRPPSRPLGQLPACVGSLGCLQRPALHLLAVAPSTADRAPLCTPPAPAPLVAVSSA